MTDSVTPPRAMSDVPLPPPPPHDSDLLALVVAMMDQQPVDPTLQARFAAPDAVAARATRADHQRDADWPNLARYRAANAAVRERPEMVMIGDSLTEIWGLAMPELFGNRVLNRGIGGQTSPQIVLRFMADVVDLAPARVHILCGTNDVAGNTGPTLIEDYQRNMRAMVALATAHGIEAVVAALPPAAAIIWNPDARPHTWIPRLNDWLRGFAAERGLRFVDYHALLTDGRGGLAPEYSADGVHVTRAAYRRMHTLLERALADA